MILIINGDGGPETVVGISRAVYGERLGLAQEIYDILGQKNGSDD